MKKITCLFSAFFLLTAAAGAQQIAQWRGDGQRGIYPGKNLSASWPPGGPRLSWAAEGIGNGYGSPSVSRERIYVLGEKEGQGYLSVFDLQGKLIWQAGYGPEWTRSFRGSRSQPTVAGDLVYVCSGFGNITCFDQSKRTKVWSLDMAANLQGRLTYHGHAESLLIEGDRIFLTVGGTGHNVVALNRFTGKLIWTCKGRGEIPGYNSPTLIKLPGRSILATFTAYSLLGIDAQTGELLWWHEQDNIPVEKRKPGQGDTHSNTIWYEDGFIYYVAGDGNCAVKLELSKDGRTIRQVWRNREADNYMGGFIKLAGQIYSCSDAKKALQCIDAGTGRITGVLPAGTGAVISAGGLLYYYSQDGKMALIRPAAGQPETISSFEITKGTKEHYAHPVIANGILFIRHGDALLAYGISGKSST